MKIKITITAILLTFCAFAQQKEVKFGKVPKELILQKEHHLDKEAEAAIIYKKERLFYDYDGKKGFRTIRDVHLRIKVYKKSGLSYGSIKIPLYVSNSAEEKIGQIKGYTFNTNDGKIQEEKLKKDAIFRENISKYRNQASIAMPEVREGSVIDLEYRITSNLTGYMDDFRFQYGIPVDHIDISVEIPEYFVFKRYARGFYPISLERGTKNRKITVQYREEQQTTGAFDRNGSSEGNRTSNLEFSENTYKVKVDDIPALRSVDYTDNIDNYRSAITFELASTQFPNSAPKNYSQTWDDVAKAINNYDDFGPELSKTRYFKDDIDGIIAKVENTDQLPVIIYEYVKNSIAWNGYGYFWSENGVQKAYEEKKGNTGDINLMLTSMLRYAGLKANPVLVSTKSNGIPLFPTTRGFNYVITAIENNNGSISLMDATDKALTFNMLPDRAMNWNGRLVREDGTSKSISLTPKIPSKKIVFLNAQIGEDGSISGKIRNQNVGHFAYDYRKALKNSGADEVSEDIQDGYLDMDVEDLVLKNQNECYKPLIESYSFFKESETELISEKIYFKPGLFLAMKESPFKMEERQYPIDFVYPKYEKTTVNIVIPEGYKVEFLPENLAIGLPDGLGKFSYAIKPNGNQLQFSCTTEINKAIVSPNYYASLKEFYNQMVIKQNEEVVLSKI